MSDPPPPSPPPGPQPGSGRGNTPPLPSSGSGSPGELPRLPSGGGIRPGYPVDGDGGGALPRPSSSGSLRPGSSGSGRGPMARNPSREMLAPLDSSPQIRTRQEDMPRLDGGPPTRLAPLSGSRPSSGVTPGMGDRSVSTPSMGAGARVPPLDLSGGDGGVPPPPPRHPEDRRSLPSNAALASIDDTKNTGAAALAARGNGASTNEQATARGPVKWVPHTHSNPKHAKFCFICLHGKLEGQKDGIEDQLVKQRLEEEDRPGDVEMKEGTYLLPGNKRFARTGADFEGDNLTALWLRETNDKVYDETTRNLISYQNGQILSNLDVKLSDDREDEKDVELLAKMFELSEEEKSSVNSKYKKLGIWCESQEERLLDVMPEPHPKPPLPEVDAPDEVESTLLEYKPLLDLSQLKGDSAQSVRDLVTSVDAAISGKNMQDGKKTYDGFKVTSLPKPTTHPDLPECKILPYPLDTKDIPEYEFTPPSELVRQPIDALVDPFPHAFLHLPDFHETIMPEFPNAVPYGEPRALPPKPAVELWLTKTRSIFADNNGVEEKIGNLDDEDEEEPDWGKVPPRERIRLPLIDEPYQPPLDIVMGDEGKRLVVRGIWDPELVTIDGQPVPPVRSRGRDLYQEPEYEHPEKPIWSAVLSPAKPREEKINNMCKPVPVRSFARFLPKKVVSAIPDFLWAIAREDSSGQDIWTVVVQRDQIPKMLLNQEREKEAEEQHLQDMEAEAIAKTQAKEEDAFRKQMLADAAAAAGKEEDPFNVNVQPLPSGVEEPPGPAGETLAATNLSTIEIDAPEAPGPALLTGAARDVPQSPIMSRQTSPSGATQSRTRFGVDQTLLQAHEDRVAGLGGTSDALASRGTVKAVLPPGGGGMSFDQLLTDEKVIDTLAEKIASKLGGPNSTMYPGATQNNWMGGSSSGGAAGFPVTAGGAAPKLIRPDPPSFAEPADALSRAELPRALQGGGPGGKKLKTNEAVLTSTVSDVNHFTMEKMRGDCYVRLLVHPEANAARKDPVPYKGAPVPPDASLLTGGGRPLLKMPPREARQNEDGEYEVEDEFRDFDKNDSIVFSFVRHNHYDAVEALIQQDTSVLGARDDAGNNLLHVAVQNNNRRMGKLLLKNGINVNDQNNTGNTALHYCYQYKFSALQDFLIANGADENIPNHTGFFPKDGVGKDDDIGVAQQQLRAGRG
eukprot:TRINITY_DN31786_c0_g1_i1.p1 TRINITY_DN31786_c0_g1~~TRINITY_DN31786_c0_g1_i1.p1  ORF type:complete len:1188 (+),score=241.89 TRINITY_DN31786_c0_g1_i1:126-3689(+)